MFEIRFHGRGGQGVVMASEILALAAFYEGKYPQSFPAFGLERRGAPVAAFCRIDSEKIMLRQGIYEPDLVVVMDPSLLTLDATLTGLKPKTGSLLINTDKEPASFSPLGDFTIGAVDAFGIAIRHGLGTRLFPIINTTILGAVIKMAAIASLENLLRAIDEHIGTKADENKSGAREAFSKVVIQKAP
jgi:pyruvate ferredoxin oxidoreductase gamma subunit/2-oxoisovalerate ferredoxin oxidoreductase gamma subunit